MLRLLLREAGITAWNLQGGLQQLMAVSPTRDLPALTWLECKMDQHATQSWPWVQQNGSLPTACSKCNADILWVCPMFSFFCLCFPTQSVCPEGQYNMHIYMQHSRLFDLISITQRLCRQWQCEVCQLIADPSCTKLIFANSAKHTILIAKRRQNNKNWRGPQWQKQRQIALRRIPEPCDTDPWLENKSNNSIFICPDSHISKISNISLKVKGRLSVHGHFVNLLKRRQRKPRLADGLISAMETAEVSGAYGHLKTHTGGKNSVFELDLHWIPSCMFLEHSRIWSIEKYLMLTEKMLHGRAKTSAKGKMDTSQGSTWHQSISCSQNSPSKTIYNIFFNCPIGCPLSNTVHDSEVQFLPHSAELAPKVEIHTNHWKIWWIFLRKNTYLKTDWIHWIRMCTKDIVISFFAFVVWRFSTLSSLTLAG